MSEDKKVGRVLRFAVGSALLVAPLAVGCGGASATAEETHTVNEPAQEEPVQEAPPEEGTEMVNEPAP